MREQAHQEDKVEQRLRVVSHRVAQESARERDAEFERVLGDAQESARERDAEFERVPRPKTH